MDARGVGIVQVLCPKNERRLSRTSRSYTQSRQKRFALGQAYYKYARDCGHLPVSYRVLKALYKRHIEGKNVPFHRYIITPRRT